MAKGTTEFHRTITAYLDKLAEDDNLFKQKYVNPDKNIENCVTYILNEVQKSGCNGFADEEIYSMAVHYYTESNIDIGKEIRTKVVVNHKVEITEQEKIEIKQKAIEQAIVEEKTRITNRQKGKKEVVQDTQGTLF